jgi:tetratricopeptide (TPR) repeat protein
MLLAALLAAGAARAQVAAPSLVEDELPPEEPRRHQAAGKGAAQPTARPGEPVPEPVTPPPVEPTPPPAASPSREPIATPGATPGAKTAATPAMPGVTISAEELRKLQRPIEPVKASYPQIREIWHKRRRAVREQDLPQARAAQNAILEAMRDLGIENLPSFATALIREAERSLAANATDEALEQARFAAALAPDLPDAHLAVFRAQLAKDPGHPLAALSELWAAFGAATREPHAIRAVYGDLASAGLAALVTASAAAIALLFARRLRLFLHDSRHLPLIRAGAPVQAALLALVLVSLPLVFRLGPFAVLLALAAAAWLYLSTSERIVATAALAAIVVTPHLVLGAARLTAWAGTTAEQVFELEHGGDCGERAAILAARSERESMPPPLLAALGRCFKRKGDLDAALRLYERAATADGNSAEVQVNLGNVLFLKGDLEGAKAAYLAATDRATRVTTLAVAHYDLSKLYLRLAAVEQSTEARKKAQLEDAGYLDMHGSDDDFRANRWLVDVSVPWQQMDALAAADTAPQRVAEAVRARLAGAIPIARWPAVPAALVAALWALALLGRRIGPSHVCEKCGRPACRRCDGLQSALCGQCINVFQRRGLVEPRDRLRKEAQVRRYAHWNQTSMRILAVVAGGAGHLFGGRPLRGYLLLTGLAFAGFLVWFWQGTVPPPFSSPYAFGGKLLVALPLGIVFYALALRDAFRR